MQQIIIRKKALARMWNIKWERLRKGKVRKRGRRRKRMIRNKKKNTDKKNIYK